MNPTNAKTSVTTTEAFSKHETTGTKNSAESEAAQVAGDETKAFHTARALAALSGIALIATTDDRDRPLYVASRWALCKTFDSIPAVTEWLRQVTGARI